MAVLVLSDEQRRKWDSSDDALFYSQPRFVHHLDEAFRHRLTSLYRERIPADAVVLDLMSSWVSHLPDEVHYQSVIGHGLNAEELQRNPRLDRHWVQNLNTDQLMPLDDASVDVSLIVAGWQYLQQPEAIASELLRITRPSGQVLVSFSNRMFFTKAPQIWADGSDQDHLAYVGSVLLSQGWSEPEVIAEKTRNAGLVGYLGGKGDPFFSVICHKPSA